MKGGVSRDQMSSALFFLLGLLICFFSMKYKIGSLAAPGSGLMPFLAGLMMSMLSLFGFAQSTLKGQEAGHWQPAFKNQAWRKSLLTLAALVGFQLLMKPIGFVLTTVLFIGFLLRAVIPQRWPVVAVVSLLTALFTYIVFDVWLQAQLPKGMWGF
jgi:putative tricarboxylic transport membrane protein